VLGKRYGKLVPAIRTALAHSDRGNIAMLVARGGLLTIEMDGRSIELAPDEILIATTAAQGLACTEDASYLVGLHNR
jgi:isoleucyl-tRNA synthetase